MKRFSGRRHALEVRSDPISELGGLRALARSLVHGDADADDLLQDAAVAALEHPPELDRPVRPWLATVILNRWRMDRRSSSRRRAREQALEAPVATEVDAGERAQMLSKLSEAVAKLAEPYRYTVIARYFDGRSSIDIARELGIPAVTVRTRLARALDMLRAALDEQAPRRRWQKALLPGGLLVKKTSISAGVLLLLFLLAAGAWWVWPRGSSPPKTPIAAAPGVKPMMIAPKPAAVAPAASHAEPTAGQKRASIETAPLAGGAASGRVINWSTGEGVVGAELTFASDAGAVSVKTAAEGTFELVGATPGAYTLAQVAAPGFLPYSPEFLHSSVRFDLTRDHAVRGLTVFLFPALDYHGRVVDDAGKPVAGAKITLVGTPSGEQSIDRIEAAWTSDKDGRFTFHAADDAVLEAAAGDRHGWARLDGSVAITKQMTIAIAKRPARDAVITGHVLDEQGKGLPDVLVRADPERERDEQYRMYEGQPRATAFAITNPDGAFELRGLDPAHYELAAEAEEHAPVTKPHVLGGTRGVTLNLTAGVKIAGHVKASDGAVVPAFTLLVYKRAGALRDLVLARSIVDANGKFEVRVEPGPYELVASASALAPSKPTAVTAPADGVELAVSVGAKLTGTVVSTADGSPIPRARVMREALGGGASAQPANAGTVTRADGTFELTGIPDGPVSITVSAGDFDQKIEAGMTASDGATLGPVTVALSPVAPGAEPKLDLVGIGVRLTAEGDDLLVQGVIAHGGAEAAGIKEGDHIAMVDGVAVADIGMEAAIAKCRGVEGTQVAIGLRRNNKIVTLLVTRTKIQA